VANEKSMSAFITAIKNAGGMSMSNSYDVEFELTGDLKSYISGLSGTNYEELTNILCDEAQLPNIQAATGQVNGVHMGEGQISYPHTKLYSDFSLGWMCDANMTPLKFVTAWHNYIFNGASNEEIKKLSGNTISSVKNSSSNNINRAVRLKYPNEYLATVRVTKAERGKSAPNSRGSISYILQECYPYSIDAVPLSYGTSQITKVTANFYYRKHTIVYNNISKYSG